MTTVAKSWNPDSWKAHEARHLPVYEDAAALAAAESTLSTYPPLVFAGEARSAAQHPARAVRAAAWVRCSAACYRLLLRAALAAFLSAEKMRVTARRFLPSWSLAFWSLGLRAG